MTVLTMYAKMLRADRMPAAHADRAARLALSELGANPAEAETVLSLLGRWAGLPDETLRLLASRGSLDLRSGRTLDAVLVGHARCPDATLVRAAATLPRHQLHVLARRDTLPDAAAGTLVRRLVSDYRPDMERPSDALKEALRTPWIVAADGAIARTAVAVFAAAEDADDNDLLSACGMTLRRLVIAGHTAALLAVVEPPSEETGLTSAPQQAGEHDSSDLSWARGSVARHVLATLLRPGAPAADRALADELLEQVVFAPLEQASRRRLRVDDVTSSTLYSVRQLLDGAALRRAGELLAGCYIDGDRRTWLLDLAARSAPEPMEQLADDVAAASSCDEIEQILRLHARVSAQVAEAALRNRVCDTDTALSVLGRFDHHRHHTMFDVRPDDTTLRARLLVKSPGSFKDRHPLPADVVVEAVRLVLDEAARPDWKAKPGEVLSTWPSLHDPELLLRLPVGHVFRLAGCDDSYDAALLELIDTLPQDQLQILSRVSSGAATSTLGDLLEATVATVTR